jgi:hypothetical protein
MLATCLLLVVGVWLPSGNAFNINSPPARRAWCRAACAARQLAGSSGGGGDGEQGQEWRALPHVDRGQAIRIAAGAIGGAIVGGAIADDAIVGGAIGAIVGGAAPAGAATSALPTAAAAAVRSAPPSPRSAASIDGWTALPVWPVWPTPASPVYDGFTAVPQTRREWSGEKGQALTQPPHRRAKQLTQVRADVHALTHSRERALSPSLYQLGGRVRPIAPDPVAADPFLLLAHHRHSFSPGDPLRAPFRAIGGALGLPYVGDEVCMHVCVFVHLHTHAGTYTHNCLQRMPAARSKAQ